MKKAKKANSLFLRTNTEARDQWISKALKEIDGLEKRDVIVNNKNQSTEPVLFYKNHRVLWCSPRTGMLFGVYLYPVEGDKEILKIHNDVEMEELFTKVKAVCEAIDSLPPKAPKSPKAHKKSKELRPISKVLEQLDKMGKSKAMSVPSGYLPNNKEFVKAVEEHGFKFDWSNRLIMRA